MHWLTEVAITAANERRIEDLEAFRLYGVSIVNLADKMLREIKEGGVVHPDDVIDLRYAGGAN